MSKLDSLEPEFKKLVEQLIQAVEGVSGRKWICTSGRRTLAEQRRIYAQGRTSPGNIVSNAPAGSSPHNFGLAADLAPLTPDAKSIDWKADRILWENMADIAVEMGLVAGAHFRTICDLPHVEAKNWRETQVLWKAGKINVA